MLYHTLEIKNVTLLSAKILTKDKVGMNQCKKYKVGHSQKSKQTQVATKVP